MKILHLTDPSPYGFFPVTRAYILDVIATNFRDNGKFDKAMKFIHEAMFVIKTFKLETGICSIFINYGSLLSKRAEYIVS